MGCVSAPSRGWSGPIVSDGVIYVGTIKGKVIALYTENGQKIPFWELELEEQSAGFGCSGGISTPMSTYGTPVVKNELVYVGGYDGKVYPVRTDGFSSTPFDTGSAIIGSPVIDGDTLFVGNTDGKLYALSTDNIQDEKWEEPFQTGGKIWSTPAVHNGVVYIGSSDHRLYAIDAESGKEIWRFKAEAAIFSTPYIPEDEDRVYIGACDNKFYAIDAATEAEIQEAITRGEGESAPVRTTDWVFDGADNFFWTTALIHNGEIWVGNLDHNVYVIDAQNPQVSRVALPTEGRIRTPPVLVKVDDKYKIVIGSEDGIIYIINPEDKTWGTLRDLEAPILAPIYADKDNGIIYVHAQNGDHYLYAINVETRMDVWMPYKTS